MRYILLISILLFFAFLLAPAQQSAVKASVPVQAPRHDLYRSTYVLGANDQILIRTSDIEDTERAVRIPQDGYIDVPLAGRVLAAGLTPDQLEAVLKERLKPFVKEPKVWVDVTEFQSQPVSIIGAVRNPGVYQLEGHKTLVDMIAAAGGLREDAGYSVTITHPAAAGDAPSSDPTQRTVLLNDLLAPAGSNSEDNVEIKPFDVISVPVAAKVYVVGEVKKAGAFVLSERADMSVLEAVSLAEGLGPNAAAKGAKILRTNGISSARTEMPIDLNKILAGKSNDVALQANDILFVPSSTGKKASSRAIEAAVQAASLLIWRVP